MAYKTNLGGGGVDFATMMNNGFGIVTVMNADIYEPYSSNEYKTMTAYDVIKNAPSDRKHYCRLETLKIANVTQEGPTKTVTGGQFSNPLIKFGKSARLEMQDALGNANAIEALCGGVREWNTAAALDTDLTGLHFGEDFVGPKLIIGDSFFIDRKSGQQVQVKIVFYQFLPDSIFNLTQDAEGDATVFDMNGDLLTTVILVGKDGSNNQPHGVFYSIIDPEELTSTAAKYFTVSEPDQDGAVTIAAQGTYTVEFDGEEVESAGLVVAKGTAGVLVVKDANGQIVVDTVFRN